MDLPTNRAAAKAIGSMLYTGSACSRCNETIRYVSNKGCLECNTHRARRRSQRVRAEKKTLTATTGVRIIGNPARMLAQYAALGERPR